MSFGVAWPLAWDPNTEQALCERLGRALRESKMDPTLIRGQFNVLDIKLGGVTPAVKFTGVTHAVQDSVGLALHLQYDDATEDGFSITIGGAEISLTGTESDDATFSPNKLWYPFEVTMYNLKLRSAFGLDISVKKQPPLSMHRPPPASALHELQMGRLKAARDPQGGAHNSVLHRSSSDSIYSGVTHFAAHPQGVRETALAYRKQSVSPNDSISPPLTKRLLSEFGGVGPTGGPRRQGGGFGLAYASRRVHYPRWPRGGGQAASSASRVSPSHTPQTPSHASHMNSGVGSRAQPVGLVNAPSLLSLEAGNSVNDAGKSLSSPSNSVTAAQAFESSPERVPHPLVDGAMNVRIGFNTVPDVDFSLRTNFRSLRGADEQVCGILKSLLRPKLELLLRGIVICLPEGRIELGPERSTPTPQLPAYSEV